MKCRLDCRYSSQNIFNAKNLNPHKKLISLLNVPICTQGMQQLGGQKPVLSLSLDIIGIQIIDFSAHVTLKFDDLEKQ